jgi:hypothetical protein
MKTLLLPLLATLAAAPAKHPAPKMPAPHPTSTSQGGAASAPGRKVVVRHPLRLPGSAGVRAVPAQARALPSPVPACEPLPPLRSARAFRPGESLEFTLDAMGAEAGKLQMTVGALEDGKLPIHVTAQSNTFFSKIRKVRGAATGYLDPRTLRSVSYEEDSLEGGIHRTAQVGFTAKPRQVDVRYTIDGRPGHRLFSAGATAQDTAGALFLLRQLPLREGASYCFDAYGIRRLWRVRGTVGKREHVSLPIGEFDAWHLSGTATRLDNPRQVREVHVWISDDSKRLPLAAVGTLDLGAVRATLTRYARPGEKPVVAQTARDLSW